MVIKHLQRVFLGIMLLLLCGFGNSARASHLAAADLYLNYIGTGPNDLTYRITLVIYKACEIPNATLGNTANITIKSVSCNQTFPSFSISITCTPPNTIITDIDVDDGDEDEAEADELWQQSTLSFAFCRVPNYYCLQCLGS